MKLRLIDEWKSAWRYASVWASGAGIAALTTWNMMPGAVKDAVPDWIEVLVGGLLWGAVFLARGVAQPVTAAKIEEKRNGG